jgi:hypothetical protein
MRFLFDCGALPDTTLAGITLQETELSEHRLVDPTTALELLSGPLRRRVGAALAASECVYLEDGRPVAAVTGGVVRPQAVPSSSGTSRKK